MSTTKNTPVVASPMIYGQPLPITEIAVLLIKHYGLHEGLFDVVIEFQIGTGLVGPSSELSVPGAMLGISKIGLSTAQIKGPVTLDAAIVNPAPTTKKASKPKTGNKNAH